MTRLTQIYRQTTGSLIPCNAAKIKAQDENLIWDKDGFTCISEPTDEQAAEKVCRIYQKEAAETETAETVVLCPRRAAKSDNGHTHACASEALTIRIRDLVNPIKPGEKAVMTVGGVSYHKGDRVMQTKNQRNGASVNGDTGTIMYVELDGDVPCACLVKWDYMPDASSGMPYHSIGLSSSPCLRIRPVPCISAD